MIEDLKALFKDKVGERRLTGTITPEYLASLKTKVAQLSLRLTQLVLTDSYAVTARYERFYELAKKNTALFQDLITRAEQVRKNDAFRDNRSFTELESDLIALISEFRSTVKVSEQVDAGERHGGVLREKRRERLEHVFAPLKEQYRGDIYTIR